MGGICRHCGDYDEYPNRAADGYITCWKCADRPHKEPVVAKEPEKPKANYLWEFALFKGDPINPRTQEANYTGYHRVQEVCAGGKIQVEFPAAHIGPPCIITHYGIFQDGSMVSSGVLPNGGTTICSTDVFTMDFFIYS